MEKQKIIQRGNSESLGKMYLKKAVTFALDGLFGKSFEYLKEGLDVLTCDCNTGWRKEYKDSKKDLFIDIEISHQTHSEYYFVKAFLLSYEKEKKNLYLALDAIDRYQNEVEDEYGYYVKGKILKNLNEYEKAEEQFLFGKKIKCSPRLEYVIGRLREQHLGEFGLNYLFNSFNDNPSSACCTRALKKYMKVRGLELQLENDEKNILILSFQNSEDEWEFDKLYERYLNTESILSDITDDTFPLEIETFPIITEFKNRIRNNKNLFVLEEDNDSTNELPNGYEDYGNSYEEYGGYNGYSDDVINDAFDGDPTATWNIE